jgi:hypothetical protein
MSRPLALAFVGRRTAVLIGATARCAASNIAVHLVFSPHAMRSSRRRNEVPIGVVPPTQDRVGVPQIVWHDATRM